MNGRFQFSTDLAFDPNNFRTYPERLFIRVPAASASFLPTHVGVLFAQDKWAIGNLTVNLGLRYDIEATPMPNDFNPSIHEGQLSGRQEQPFTAYRPRVAAGRFVDATGARRMGNVLRQDHADHDDAVPQPGCV